MRIAGDVERGDELAVLGRADQEVDVGGPHAVPLLAHDHLPHGPVERDEIAQRPDGADHVVAVLVGAEDAAAIDLLDALLDVVAPIGGRLPHGDHGVRQRRALGVGDTAVEHDLGALRLLGDLGAFLEDRRVLAEEWTEQACACRLFHLGLVMHDVDERGKADRIRQQDELLPGRRAHLADLGHELDALDPLGGGQLHIAGEGMQVAHRRLHDLLHARVRRRGHLLEDSVGDVVRGVFTHGASPLATAWDAWAAASAGWAGSAAICWQQRPPTSRPCQAKCGVRSGADSTPLAATWAATCARAARRGAACARERRARRSPLSARRPRRRHGPPRRTR